MGMYGFWGCGASGFEGVVGSYLSPPVGDRDAFPPIALVPTYYSSEIRSFDPYFIHRKDAVKIALDNLKHPK